MLGWTDYRNDSGNYRRITKIHSYYGENVSTIFRERSRLHKTAHYDAGNSGSIPGLEENFKSFLRRYSSHHEMKHV